LPTGTSASLSSTAHAVVLGAGLFVPTAKLGTALHTCVNVPVSAR
jgi:hypothetical protein